jgi:hypothetical protein
VRLRKPERKSRVRGEDEDDPPAKRTKTEKSSEEVEVVVLEDQEEAVSPFGPPSERIVKTERVDDDGVVLLDDDEYVPPAACAVISMAEFVQILLLVVREAPEVWFIARLYYELLLDVTLVFVQIRHSHKPSVLHHRTTVIEQFPIMYQYDIVQRTPRLLRPFSY